MAEMAGSTSTGAVASARKIDRGDLAVGCPVQHDADGVWQVRGYAAGRTVLRSTETLQNGLGIENIEKMPAKIRRPVLYRDGAEHREHRRQTARYFTPRRVNERYRELMVRIADEQLERLRRDGSADLSELSFKLAVEVAAAVIGLTDGRKGMDRRLDRFFPEKFGQPGFTSISGVYWFLRNNYNLIAFYLNDVRPAVRARRRERADDLISHLIDEGCNNGEILGECITFAPAGMITTREFINVAAWHLFTDDALRERYQAGNETQRIAILHEFLRLEPVVSTLKRRTTADIDVPGADGPVTIPAGARVEVSISAANLDPAAIGTDPLAVCPAREMSDGTGVAGLSFGDGPHKCPGAHVAIQETDIFLAKLFALDGLRMVSPPRVSEKPDISAYELRGMVVAIR